MRKRLKTILYWLASTLLLASSLAFGSSEKTTVRVALIDSVDPNFYVYAFGPLMEELREKLPQLNIVSEEVPASITPKELEAKGADFVISPAIWFALYQQSGALRQIAALQTSGATDASLSIGSAIVVPITRGDISSLSDIAGKKIAALDPHALDGWLAAKAELLKAGLKSDKLERQTIFTEYGNPDVLAYLAAGEADVGIVAACTLEQALANGSVKPGSLKVLASQTTEGACQISTPLYPGPVFASLPNTPAHLVKEISLQLLSMPKMEDGSSWGIANDFRAVLELFKTLQMGPYAPHNLTVEEIWQRFKMEIVLALALLAGLVFHIWRVNALVFERTENLRAAIKQRDAMTEAARASQARLHLMERRGLVSQLSSIIAHELKQPLSAAINYANGLELYLKSSTNTDPIVRQATQEIRQETQKASEIVDKVRSLGRTSTDSVLEHIELGKIVQDALTSFKTAYQPKARITIDSKNPCPVFVDPLEIRLLVINLLKNAAEATPTGHIAVTLSANETSVLLTLEDDGPALDQAQFALVSSCSAESFKEGGLGLGLSIVKTIAERHGAQLRFEQIKPQGLRAIVQFKKDSQ